MAIDFEWADDARTIMHYIARAPWDWGELHRTLRRSHLRFDEVNHPVESIIDFGGARLPAGAVGHVRTLGSITHPNAVARVIVIGVPDDVQAAMGARDGVYRTGDRAIYFAADLPAAHALTAPNPPEIHP